MGKKRLWLYFGIFLFLIDFALAGEVYYITQDQENSYFAFSGSPSYKDVQQTFVAPQDFTITAIALNLKALNPQGCGLKLLRIEVLDQNGNYVTDSGWLGDFENVAGSLYYNFPGYGYLNNYFDFVKIPLFDTTKDNLMSGKQYQLRIYTNVCSSSSETNPAFALAGSTSDVYSGGQASAKPASFQIKDFSFKVLGYTPQPTCKENKICEKNQIVQIYSDCSKQYLQTCSGDYVCETGSCVYKYPSLTIDSFYLNKDSFNEGETAKLTALIKRTNSISESYPYIVKFLLFKDGQSYKTTELVKNTNYFSQGGISEMVTWDVSNLEKGQYHAEAYILDEVGYPLLCNSPAICSQQKDFSVSLPCYDNDNDGVTTCQGDCNDNDASASSDKTCLYDGNSCGTYQLCINQCPSVPVEICDGVDNDCDVGVDENNVCSAATYYCDIDNDGVISSSASGTCSSFNCVPSSCTLTKGTDCDDSNNMINPSALEICDQKDNTCNLQIDETFDFTTDKNNCGGCGLVCSSNQACSSGVCNSFDGIVVSEELFNTVITKAEEKNIPINEDLKNFSKLVRDITQNYKDTNKVKEAVLLTSNSFYNFLVLFDSVKNDLLGYTYITKEYTVEWEGKISTIKSITVGSSLDPIDDILIKIKVPQIINFIKSLPPELGITTSMIIGFTQGTGSTTEDYVFNSIVYGTNNFFMFYPSVLSFIGDGVITFVGNDTPITDLVNWLKEMQYYYKQELPASKCGLSLNGFASCWDTTLNALTHPLSFINKINMKKDKATVTVKNYWGNLIGGEIYVGITTFMSNNKCNFQPQKVYLLPNESREIVFENLKIIPNQEYVITANTWYNCNPPTQSMCVPDDFCEKPLYTYSINYTLPNTQPIINDIKLNSISYATNFYEGEKIIIDVYSYDVDGEKPIINYKAPEQGLLTFDSCQETEFGSYKCTFTWQTKQGNAGNYPITFIADDGIAITEKELNLVINNNAPQITYPKQNDVTNTQNPTFKWNAIVGQLPISYTINIFEDIENNLIFTKELGDPNPGNIVKQHTLIDITLEKDKNYFIQIVALNNNGITLTSEKVKFYVDCYTNEQCGDISNSLYCGVDGHSYQETKTPTCVNHGTLQSQCVTETTTAKLNSCSYGCENGNCNTLISTPDTTDDAELSYVENENILDWRVNDLSIASLNLPFEAHAESAAKVKDYSTNKNDGVVNGALFKPNAGYDGKSAYYFSGSNNPAIIQTQPLNLLNYTISLWIKPETVTGFKNLIYIPESKRYFAVANGVCSWTGTIWTCTKKAPAINTWTHIAITSDGNVYQNGVYDARIKALPLLGTLVVGDRDQSAYDFKGHIDDVKIYNRVLSLQQIQKLANKQQSIIVSEETQPNDVWRVAATNNDGTEDAETLMSNQITIKHGINSFTPLLVSSDGVQTTDTSNLLLTQLVEPPLKNIIDWKLNGASITLLNLPFEAHAESATKVKDYSTNKNDAVVNGALFKQNTGYDGKGAYYFTANTGITTAQPINVSKYTVSLWVKPEAVTGYRNFIYISESKRYFSINNGVCSWTGTIWSCTKKVPSLNTWTHIAITSDGNVYQNGVYDGRIKVLPLTGIVTLGDRDQSAYDFKGYMDEVKIYKRILSPEQIGQLALGKEDILMNQETLPQQQWQAAVTANNGVKDGITKFTNTVVIS